MAKFFNSLANAHQEYGYEASIRERERYWKLRGTKFPKSKREYQLPISPNHYTTENLDEHKVSLFESTEVFERKRVLRPFSKVAKLTGECIEETAQFISIFILKYRIKYSEGYSLQ